MKRIAIIEDGFARGTQVFAEDPAILNSNLDWEDNFYDLKYPCHYEGIFEGDSEEEIRNKVAERMGVHPGVITLIEFERHEPEVLI